MKYGVLLVPLLTSAALAATRETRWDVRQLWPAEAAPAPLPPSDPPWLTASAELLAAHLGEETEDPHAGLYGEAELYAHGDLVDSQDPHHGLHGAGDEFPAHYADDSDPHLPARPAPSTHVVTPLPRSTAKNAHTVAELFSQRTALNETTIRLHARVVKLTEGILGKTYLHLQDGSGSAASGNGDLTATTTQTFVLGETVEVEGRLAIDQDVGLGYRYEALLTQTARVARP